MMLRITQKFISSQQVWKGTNSEEKFWFDGNNFFLTNQWNEANITEDDFPTQNEQHQPN